ncbi:hypothetical protein [Dellaglioa algida]|uniref:Uncharacterized protein n=1 Tax=Dellaglioa algida TaxID=105612 RepID=A0A5C6MCW5_9LACO|nr:hypothetical protein [Dellaglioa algida]MDK1715991.1 hypothetical protein [Dellaglioa algida]MDK1719272.1 hypothetical protein [Dellaglioa algida]MDK1721226.1 hypothetical protein [Dellaglioa algida]MDK1722615.1 hypothetical protein [Dellaglioa algida]MDK1724234.1 hypothetical protein [Dellaglioa algida]
MVSKVKKILFLIVLFMFVGGITSGCGNTAKKTSSESTTSSSHSKKQTAKKISEKSNAVTVHVKGK